MNRLKKILIFILGTQVSFTLFIMCLVFYRFLWNIINWDELKIWVSITYFLIIVMLFWVNRKNRMFTHPLLFVSVVILGVSFYEIHLPQKKQFNYEWSSPKDTLLIPFTVGEAGRIYIKARVNDTTGLFLFDTGSDLCIVNETLVKNPVESSEDHMITDAQGISQRKKQVIIDRLQISDIVCKEVLFWPADSASWGQKGMFKGKEEVLGIIGNTFITNFVWDFDMLSHTITLTRAAHALNPINEETILPFQFVDKHWKFPVSINGEEKLILLDFGHTTPLQVEETVLKDKHTKYGSIKSISESALAHTLADSMQKDSVFYFLAKNISLGNQSFDSLFCFEKAYSSLLGMPFIWAFERVVLDYPQEKIYLMKKQANPGKFDVRTINHQFHQKIQIAGIQAGAQGYFNMRIKYYADHIAPTITENQDTVMAKYKVYGKARYWGRNLYDIDSIQCMDSVLLPNGNIQYAPFTIEMK